ncbi:MAG: hypothetical protein LBQ35_09490, partial [Spirochaetaceae bacterium]|nr:hypothetical protein [Spirochaetaceae bacterium]
MKRKDRRREGGGPRGLLIRLCRALGALVIFALIAAGGGAALLLYWNSPPPLPPAVQRELFRTDTLRFEGEEAVYIEVRDGESSFSVGRRLEKAGIIRSRYFWNILSKYDGD